MRPRVGEPGNVYSVGVGILPASTSRLMESAVSYQIRLIRYKKMFHHKRHCQIFLNLPISPSPHS
ncbi:MAG: hypothetical protein F6K39_13010 [Okeania sp. SIO3B3]|nr:hypothetical protein [Okeania sp. SIO3B3]